MMNEKKRENVFLKDLLGILLIAFCIILFLSIYSYDPFDPSLSCHNNRKPFNYIGIFGSYVSDFLIINFGLATYILLIIIGYWGFYFITKKTYRAIITKMIGSFLLFISSMEIFQIILGKWNIKGINFYNAFQEVGHSAGGYIGEILFYYLNIYFNRTGSLIISFLALMLSFLLMTSLSISEILILIWRSIKYFLNIFSIKIQKRVEIRKREEMRKNVEKKYTEIRQKEIKQERESIKEKVKPRQLPLELWEKSGKYMLPPETLLIKPSEELKIDLNELKDKKAIIENKLAEFDISGKVMEMHPGPVITVYEFKPDPGIKFSKITAFSEDLALALKAESIRIDRIPGESTVGIEVPNKKREIIYLREIIETDLFKKSESKLTMAIGKYADGSPMIADLQAMPHLLIAGATGSGKSVAINCIICSILYKANPEEVKFILIDPKRVELKLYDRIPHLLVPVIWEPKQASNALKWLVSEMTKRHQQIGYLNVRNIAQYNNVVENELDELDNLPESKDKYKPLPYIVLIIDELADLMMMAASDIEESIQRLSQMARAVGIHLILATQRPSVDVITGVIKANFPCRISFKVSSRVDSRTILDVTGAEQLLGKGDMLFIPPGMPRLLRVHGAYVSEKEINKLVNFWNRQAEPEYSEEILLGEKEKFDFNGEKDPLYDEAVKIILETKQASASYLQRRLKIGFNRAARLIEQMEAEGIVGPAYGSKPREVLIDKNEK